MKAIKNRIYFKCLLRFVCFREINKTDLEILVALDIYNEQLLICCRQKCLLNQNAVSTGLLTRTWKKEKKSCNVSAAGTLVLQKRVTISLVKNV